MLNNNIKIFNCESHINLLKELYEDNALVTIYHNDNSDYNKKAFTDKNLPYEDIMKAIGHILAEAYQSQFGEIPKGNMFYFCRLSYINKEYYDFNKPELNKMAKNTFLIFIKKEDIGKNLLKKIAEDKIKCNKSNVLFYRDMLSDFGFESSSRDYISVFLQNISFYPGSYEQLNHQRSWEYIIDRKTVEKMMIIYEGKEFVEAFFKLMKKEIIDIILDDIYYEVRLENLKMKFDCIIKGVFKENDEFYKRIKEIEGENLEY